MFKKKQSSFVAVTLKWCMDEVPGTQWKYDAELDAVFGDSHRINLGNLRKQWQSIEPAKRSAWMHATMLPLVRGAADGSEPDAFDSSRIFAVIRARMYLETARLMAATDNKPPAEIPHRNLTPDIVGVLMMDSATTMAMVTQRNIIEWGTSFEELWRIGVENIGNLPNSTGMRFVNEKVFVSNEADDYTNARILAPGLLEQLPLQDPKVVLLPHRNSLIVCSATDPQGIEMACRLALEELEQAGQISFRPLIVQDGEFKPLVLDPSHPAQYMVRTLELLDAETNYQTSQKELQHQLGETTYVAGFKTIEQGDGVLWSQTIWTEGEVLLPQADLVIFHEPGEPPKAMQARWSDVIERCGDIMEATGHYPPRWRVAKLPDAEIIREISQPMQAALPF